MSFLDVIDSGKHEGFTKAAVDTERLLDHNRDPYRDRELTHPECITTI